MAPRGASHGAGRPGMISAVDPPDRTLGEAERLLQGDEPVVGRIRSERFGIDDGHCPAVSSKPRAPLFISQTVVRKRVVLSSVVLDGDASMGIRQVQAVRR